MLTLMTAPIMAALSTPPTFADGFYVGEQIQTLINQGGYARSGSNDICCAGSSPSCRVEAQLDGSGGTVCEVMYGGA